MASSKRKDAPQVTKRRVHMANRIVTSEVDDSGNRHDVIRLLEATDYVRPDILDAYVADARRRWEIVEVSDEPDAGPAGYDGPTFVPFGVQQPIYDRDGNVERVEWHEFPHELAGTYYPATGCKNCDHAPEHPLGDGRARTVTEG